MLTSVVFILSLNEVLADINIALDKNITFCQKRQISRIMVDGETEASNAEKINEICDEDFTFKINLEAEYIIHYVVIYEGELSDGHGPLDEIVVAYENRHEITSSCSKFHSAKRGSVHSKGVRINCKTRHATFIKLRVNNNRGFSISEVEVYTMGSVDPIKNILVFHGCFPRLSSYIEYPARKTWKDCIWFCRNKFSLAAFTNMVPYCICAKLKGEIVSVAVDQCPKCLDRVCGGDRTYSVYIGEFQLPYYIGCYEIEGGDVEMPGTTIGQCFQTCDGQMYAALVRGQVCICKNSILDITEVNDTICDVPCEDDKDTICGGNRHGSFYGLKITENDIEMLTLMKCFNGFDEHGICKDGCQPGYIGNHCIEAINETTFSGTTTATTTTSIANTTEITRIKTDITTSTDTSAKDLTTLSSTSTDTTTISFISTTEIISITTESTTTTDTSATDLKTFPSTSTYTTATRSFVSSTEIRSIDTDISATTATDLKTFPSTSTYTTATRSFISSTEIRSIDTDISATTDLLGGECDSNPCLNVSNSKCIAIVIGYRCKCNDGYLMSETLICIDINECDFNPCYAKSSICVNQPSSFYCQCKSGYYSLSDLLCSSNDSISRIELDLLNKIMYFLLIPLLFIAMTSIISWNIGKHIEPSIASESESKSSFQ